MELKQIATDTFRFEQRHISAPRTVRNSSVAYKQKTFPELGN